MKAFFMGYSWTCIHQKIKNICASKFSLILSICFLLFTNAQAAVVTWDGEGADGTCGGAGGDGNKWSCALNWVGDTLPGSSDIATFNATSTKDTTIDSAIDVAGIDIQSGYTGTITQNTGVTITVGTSNFAQADGAFIGGNSTIQTTDLLISGGNFTSTTDTLNISDDVILSAGTFTHNSGTVMFSGIGNSAITIGIATTFNNVNINRTNRIDLNGILDIDGDLTITSLTDIDFVTSTVADIIKVAKDVTTYDTSITGNLLIELDGGGPQKLWADGGSGDLPGLHINKPTGDLDIQNTIGITEDFKYTAGAGTVNTGSSTIEFKSNSIATITSTGMSFNNVVFNKFNNVTISGVMDVNGNLTISAAENISGDDITVAKNVTTTDNYVRGGVKFIFDGDTDSILNASGGAGSIPEVEIAKGLGTFTIQDTIYITSHFTYTSGAYIVSPTNIIRFGFADGESDNTTGNITSGTFQFNDIEISKNNTFTVNGTMDINGDLTIVRAVNMNASIGDKITLAGNLISNDTDVSGSLDIEFDGTTDQTINTGPNDIPDSPIFVDKATGTLILLSNLDLALNGNTTQDLTITQGTLNLNSFDLSVPDTFTIDASGVLVAGSGTINIGGDLSNSGSFTADTSTVNLNGTSQAISGSTTFYTLKKSVASAATLTIDAGSTQTINGFLALNGATGQLLSLRSSAAGAYTFNITSNDQTVDFLDVQYANASGYDIYASNSVNNGFNDDGDATPFFIFGFTPIVTNNLDDGSPGSLRWVISNARASDTITFDTAVFPPSTPKTILLASDLPSITQGDITIDASNAGVKLDGSSTVADCLTIASNNNVIMGLEITGCNDHGIRITSGTNNTIGGDNTVGSAPLGEGNRIHGNSAGSGYGIAVYSTLNFVYGNYVGTYDGINASLNKFGVVILDDNNIVGGLLAGQRNIISGNTWGIQVANCLGTLIRNNYIGVDVTGTKTLPNSEGINVVGSTTTIIGGTTSAERNIISGNSMFGIYYSLGDGGTVIGNYIGVNALADTVLANDNVAIRLSASGANVTIGGSGAGEANIIAGGSSGSIVHSGSGVLNIDSNYIGVNSSGNAYAGIHSISSILGTTNFLGNITINGDTNISGGTVNLGSSTINLFGDWNRTGGTLNAGTSTINLDGVNQSITGSNAFNNLTKNTISSATLTFDNTATQTITGTLDLQGNADNYLTLKSDSLSNQWNIDPQGTRTIAYLAVSDSNNINGSAIISTGTNTIDAGNNTNWTFDAVPAYTWNGAINSDWHTAGNWSTNVVPGSGNIALFTAPFNNPADINSDINIGGIQIIGGYSGTITQTNGTSITIGSSGYSQSSGTFTGGNATSNIIVNGPMTLNGGTYNAAAGTTTLNYDYTYVAGIFNHQSGTFHFRYPNGTGTITGSHNLYDVIFDTTQSGNYIWNIDSATTLTVSGLLTLNNSDAGDTNLDGGIIEAKGDISLDAEFFDGSATILINGASDQTITGSGGVLPNVLVDKPGGTTLNLVGDIDFGGDWTFNTASGGIISPGTSNVRFAHPGNDGATITGSHSLNNVIFETGSSGSYTWNIEASTVLTVNGVLTLNNSTNGNTLLEGGIIEAKSDIILGEENFDGSTTLVINGVADQILSASGGRLPNVSIDKPGGTALMLVGSIEAGGDWTFNTASGGTISAGTSSVRFAHPDNAGATISGSHDLYNVRFDTGSSGTYDWNIDSSTTLTVLGSLSLENSSTGLIYLNSGILEAQGDVIVGATNTFSGSTTLLFSGNNNQNFDLTGGENNLNLDVNINKSGGVVSLLSIATFDANNQDLLLQAGTLNLNGNDLLVNGSGSIFTVDAGTKLQLKGNESVTTPTIGANSSILYTGSTGPYIIKDWAYENLIINGPGGTFELAAIESVARDLTITAGTLDINNNDLTVVGNFFNDGVIQLQGSETLSFVMDSDSGTVEYDGIGVYPSLAAQYAYFNLVFNGPGSWTQDAQLDVNGSLSLSNGTLNSNSFDLILAGDFTHSAGATYTPGINTFTLDGSNQSLSGSTSFHHFNKSVTTADTLTFNAGDTYSVLGNLTLSGASGQLLSLPSSSPGSEWFLVMYGGTQVVEYVSVQDSNASGGVTIIPATGNSEDLGNNTNWSFGGAASSVVSEISPNYTVVSTVSQAFIYTLSPTITPTDTGIDWIELTAPDGYNNPILQSVSVGGVPQVLGGSCPTLGAGETCFSGTGQMLTISLGSKITITDTPIVLSFTADTPNVPGSADFTSQVDDISTASIPAQVVIEGDADGDATNENSDTVTVEGPAVSAVVAEISPNLVALASTNNLFSYNLLTTIQSIDSGVDQVTITTPVGYSNLVVNNVSVNGVEQTLGSSCSSLVADEFCFSVIEQVMTVTLGSKQSVSGNIHIEFSADAPGDESSSADFVSTVDDTSTIVFNPQDTLVGDANDDAEDANSITVLVAGDAVASIIGEINPARVTVDQQDRELSFYLMPTITIGNTGYDHVTLSVPAGSEFDDLQIVNVIVGDGETAVDLVSGENCPSIASGEYCATSTGADLTLVFGDKITVDQTRVQIDFTVDTPSLVGSGDFTFTVDDALTPTIIPQAGVAGEADSDADNENTLTVAVRLGTDPSLSTFTVAPSIVVADGESEAILNVTLIDSNGFAVDDKIVTITSDRDVLDTINYGPVDAETEKLTRGKADKQNIEPAESVYRKSDSTGHVEARVRSLVGGIVTLTATDADGVELLRKPELFFTQGDVLQLSKRVNKRKVMVGDVVTYIIDIHNTVDRDIMLIKLLDVIPPNFKYHPGSARLGSAVLADPTGQRTLIFDIGTIPAMMDNNGNGIADNGEPGSLTLMYQLIVGAGARPGNYLNRAHAIDVCEQCQISNKTEATVEVMFDPLFDLGNIIGKVFNDSNGNGVQDEELSEFGVANVMVVLDNGTYVLTDEHGRYHFPAVLPDDRLLKVNITTLPKGSILTSPVTQVVTVTPGLLAKANFGISTMEVEQQEQLGKKGKTASKLQLTLTDSPLQFVGSLTQFTLLANGVEMDLPTANVTLRTRSKNKQNNQSIQNNEVLNYTDNVLSHPVSFVLDVNRTKSIKQWQIEIILPGGQLIRRFDGKGEPPEQLPWDGMDQQGEPLQKTTILLYQLEVNYEDGSKARSALRMLGVDRRAFIQVNLPEQVFVNDGPAITTETKTLLKQVGNLLRQFPDETVIIQGASASVGDDVNLARRRARTATLFLMNNQDIANERIDTRWDSENLAENQSTRKTGRISRFLEMKGDVREIATEIRGRPRVQLNDRPLSVDEVGRFQYHSNATTLTETWHFSLLHADGRSVETLLRIPALAIINPEPESWLYHGQKNEDYAINELSYIETLLDEETSARYQLRGKTEPGSLLTVNGKAVDVKHNGEFTLPLQLKTGLNRHYLVISNDQGMRRLATLDLTLAHHYRNGHPFYFDLPEPEMQLIIPPDGLLLTQPIYTVSGKTDMSHRVEINDQEITVDKEGHFSERLSLQPGENTIQVRTTDRGGFVSTIERTVFVDEAPYFFMAFADGKINQISRSGYLAGTGNNKEKEVIAEGRLAFYFKGWVKGKYLVTSAFDSGQGKIDTLFHDLNHSQTERLLTNLDPEALYPVYGDESTLVNDVESRGKFYLAVESNTLQVKLGNFALQWQETELANYQRTLYGLHTSYHSESKLGDNKIEGKKNREKNSDNATRHQRSTTETELFVSDVNQIHIRDEILTTGGSLYYLSHAQVIEGSEQITLIVRDRETGLLLSRTPQTQNKDYSIDYDQGRLLFNRPLSNLSSDERLADSGLFDGNSQTLQVDYEYQADDFEQNGVGLRASHQLGNVRLGGTYLQDDPGTGRYTLQGVDAEIDLSRNSRLFIELASSEGVDGYNYHSEDGGLTFRQQRTNQDVTPTLSNNLNQPLSTLNPLLESPQSRERSGNAWKISGEMDVGAWLENPDRYHAAFYLKQLDEGFVANGTFLEQGHQKAGVSLNVKLTNQDQLHARLDGDNSFDVKGYSSLFNLQWIRQQNDLTITSELQSQSTPSTAHSVAVVKVEKPWNEIITTSAEQQLTLSGEANNQTHVGAQIQASKNIVLQGKVGVGDRGEAAQLGVAYDNGKRRVYVTQKASEDNNGTQGQSTIVGSESKLGNGKVYTEHQWQQTTQRNNGNSTTTDRTLAVVGSQQSWDLHPGFNLKILGEIGDIQTQDGNSKRYVAGSGLSYVKLKTWKASTYLEWRLERGQSARSQWLSKNNIEIKLDPNYTLLGKLNYSQTTDDKKQITEAAFEERSIGLAYRPTTHDKLNALGRYSYIKDQRPLGLNPGDDRTRMSVASLDFRYDITHKLAWTEKLAARIKDDSVANLPTVTTQTTLMIHRVDYKLPKALGIGSEYRTLAVDITQDQRSGWLSELTWQANKQVRLGIGYNFTDFSDRLNTLNDYSEKGWFLRVQGGW